MITSIILLSFNYCPMSASAYFSCSLSFSHHLVVYAYPSYRALDRILWCPSVFNGVPYCTSHYLDLAQTTIDPSRGCQKCLGSITDNAILALGSQYHPTCFTCTACEIAIDGYMLILCPHLCHSLAIIYPHLSTSLVSREHTISSLLSLFFFFFFFYF